MSGDVQPRKRKDKKKKKDDLGIEEPRGTAAALGEGDIFMHSYHEHGTGGNWCAKVIFFSLLAVLVTLIGLIILENRGLSELEANSVESRYSGVLEGWLEEGHDDDHHDEHTLDLHHHDDDDDHDGGLDHEIDDDDEERSNDVDEDDDDESLEDDNDNENDEQDEVDQEDDDDEDSQEANDNDNENEDSEEQNLETAADEDENEEQNYRRYYQSSENPGNDDDDDDDDDIQKIDDDDDDDHQKVDDDDDDNDLQKVDNDDEDQNSQEDDGENEQDDEINNNSQENNDDEDDDEEEQNQLNKNIDDNENSIENDEENEDEEEHEDHQEEESDVDLEHIEEEVFDDDVSSEAPAQVSQDDNSEEVSNEAAPIEEADEDEVEFLEPDELYGLPDELPIPVPKGKPLAEMEDSISTEKPQDTLADEEEYERQQEALRREKEQTSQGMWLKLVVGGALLVATQAVLRRATAPRETEDEMDTTREETPLSDRRMTLINEPVAPPPVTTKPQEVSRPVFQKEVIRQAPVAKSAPPEEEDDDEEVEEEEIISMGKPAAAKETYDKELYSDDEEAEDEEEIIEEKKELPKPTAPKLAAPSREPPKPPVKETPKPIEKKEIPKVVEKEPTPEDEEDDDVEIIEEEDIGEDLEEEEEDISDVDDAELLTRLEAKYGRLPEPERPDRKKDGGNSIEDEWPGEPSGAYWRDELDHAERDLRQGEWMAALDRASAAPLRSSARARYIVAKALDLAAEAKRDNGLLTKAIAAYNELLKMNERLSDKKLIEITDRALDRMKFRGNYLGTEPLYRLLIRRFPDDPTHRNNLTISFLMANRADLAEEVIKETLKRWPDDRIALAHHGFILKTLHNKLEQAVDAFTKALEGDTGPANESRFYYHLGDSLLLLGRFKEAHEVHKRGAKLGHFLSPAQRSLYNVDRLKSKPWWDVEKTPYAKLALALEKFWKEILKEGQAAQALYEKEKEGLKERGEWSQLDLFVRGREVPNRCSRAPVTCKVVRSEVAASGCRRGQVKFSSMEAGTHVRPHVGPTNCRLRMHLGLSNTKDTYIRVDQETRQWQTGKVLMFDDSFEHEVWHNGTGTRLVLIVDVWHPDLTANERRQLPAI